MYRRTINLGRIWLLASFALACFTLPTQAQVVPDASLGAGKNSVTNTTGDRTDITGGLRRSSALFHSFDRFSIDTNRQVYFANPTGIRNIFSRVTGSSLSNIDGLLGVSGKANLFLMNPNGIIFGPNARLDVAGSFLATTANVLEFGDGQRFAADGDRSVPLVEVNIPIGLQIAANSPAMLNNQGNLAVGAGQSLTLAGGNTTHTGSLTAPGGTVQVLGNQVALTDQARVDVSSSTGGGTALIGGDYQGRGSLLNSTQTVVGSGVTINANATVQGNGGKVIVWADGDTQFGGSITAQGGPQGGNGGFVETSGKQTLAVLPSATVSTRAPQGMLGTWLLDPADLTVQAGGTATLAGGPPLTNTPAATATISAATIVAGLDGNNVDLQATNSITVNEAINATANGAPGNLTLTTPTTNLNQPITLRAGSTLSGTATTVNVNTGARIQNGVDAAADDATVNVVADNYTETVNVNNKPLSLNFNGAGTNLTGTLTTTAGSPVTLSGNLTTSGNQTYNDDVTIGNPTVLNAGGATLQFANPIDGGGNALTLTANAIDLGADFAGTGAFVINAGNTLQLGTSNITAGSLNITATNAITAGGTVAVTGTTTLAAGANDITLNQAGNNFNTVQITTGNNVTLVDTDAINLGASTVTGNLNLTADGDITDSGNLIVGGTTTLAANTSDITLNQAGNNFNNLTVTSGRNVTVTDTNNLNLGAIAATTSAGPSGNTITVTAGGTLLLQNDITAADFGTITLTGNTVTANLGGNTIQALAGTVNVLGNTINLNTGTIDVTGAGSKPSGGTVRFGGSFDGTTLTNANTITANTGTPAFRVEANPQAGGNRGQVFLYTNNPANPTSLLSPNGIVVSSGADINFNPVTSLPSVTNGEIIFDNITVTNGSTITVGGNTFNSIAFDGNTLYFAETFLESLSSSYPTTGLRANNQFTIDPLTTDGTLTLAGFSQFAAGTTFTTRAADTISKAAGDFAIVVGDPTVFNAAASLNAGAVRTFGSNLRLESAGSLTTNNALNSGGGSLTLNSAGNLITNGSLTTGGGVLNVTAGSITNINRNVTINSPVTTNGGSLNLSASGAANLNSTVTTSAIGPARGGNVAITGATNVTLAGGSNITTGGGDVTARSTNGTLSVGNLLVGSTVNTSRVGNPGGNITFINNNGNINLTNSSITSNNSGNTGFSQIWIESTNGSVNLNNVTVSAANAGIFDLGFAGDILINASNAVGITGSFISTNGDTGRILIGSSDIAGTDRTSAIDPTPQTITITNSNLTTTNASILGSRDSGSISLNAQNQIAINGATSRLSAETSGIGKAGSITIQTPTLNVDGATLSTAARAAAPALPAGTDPAGTITLKPLATGNTATLTVNLANGANINASTAGARQSGSIDISAPQSVTISGNGTLRAETSGSGNAGSVTVQTATLNVTGSTISTGATATATALPAGTDPGGKITLKPLDTGSTATLAVNLADKATITASTAGDRSGGSISVTAPQSVTLGGSGSLRAETSGSGNAGEVRVVTPDLTLQNGVQLSTSTTGTGQGGSILIGAATPDPNVLTFANRVSLNNSRLDAQTNGAGTGGNIDIQALSIGLTNNSVLNAGVLNTGNGGTIALDTNGGTIALDNSQISTAIESTGTGSGNTITVDTATLSLVNGARIQSQTSGTGNAGDVQINVDTALTASGSNAFGRFSGILASSENPASGSGGDIAINDAANLRGQVMLSNNAFLAANTRSSNDSGNIAINVENLELRSGGQVLTAASETSSGRAGSITVNATGQVSIADAAAPPTTTSPFAALTVLDLADGNFQVSNNANVLNSTTVPFQSANAPAGGGFAYYGFNVAAGNSQGTFDIDGGYKFAPGSIDTQIFLFDRTTGNLLASNDDSSVDPGSTPVFGSLTFDSFINHTFSQPGAYVIGVGAFPSSVVGGTAPIAGTAPLAGQTYTLNLSLTSPGTGGATNPINLNPNLPLDNGLLASGLYASSKGTGAAGSVTVITPNLTLDNQGTIAASNVSSTGQDISLQGLNTLTVSGDSQITASTRTGTAGNVKINEGGTPAAIVSLQNGRIAAEATGAGNNPNSRAGNVAINAQSVALTDGSEIATRNISSVVPENDRGNFGNIQLSNLNQLNVTNSTIAASTESGVSGSITVAATQGNNPAITLNNSQIAAAATQAGGQAGGISITTPTLALTDATIAASNINAATGGNVTFNNLDTLTALNSVVSASTRSGVAGGVSLNQGQAAARSVTLSGTRTAGGSQGSIIATATDGGNAGSVRINTTTLDATNGASIAASSDNGVGTAGGVDITATTVNLTNAGISAETDAGGASSPANITLQGLQRLNVNNGQISSSTNSGVAGSVTVNATEQVNLTGSTGRIAAEARQGGNAGSVSITAPNVEINNGAAIAVSSDVGAGTAGGVEITATTVNLNNNAQISAETDAGGATSPANITLEGLQTLNVNNSQISSSTNSGQAGSVEVGAAQQVNLDNNGRIAAEARQGGSAGSVSIAAPTVEIANGASIAVSSANGAGTAGGVNVTASTVNLSNNAQISAETDAGGATNPANITLQGLQTLNVNNGQISSSTNSGQAGSVAVNAAQQVNLTGNDAAITAEARQGGNAGSVSITTPNLEVNNGASIAASSRNGAGTAGGVNITASTVNLSNTAQISAETDAGGAASPANITLQGLQNLNVNNGSISSSTNSGQAGSVAVNAAQQINLDNSGRIAAEARQGGSAGSVNITTPDLQINNGASIAASSRNGAGRAGGVDITASTVNLNNSAQISAETDAGGAISPANITLQGLQRLNVNNSLISSSTNSGGAGSVTVNAPTGQVTLNGNNSGIIAEARQGGSAGNVDIIAGQLLIQNGARAAVSSPNGQAGNLSVRANSVRLDRGTLSAETATGFDTARISIVTQQPFLLRRGSLISASAGQQANGGNISISTPFLIGLSFENSDITANSVRGSGGTINITTNAIFGLQFRPRLTPLSDITASSEFGVSGNVIINSLNLDPSRGLTQLPTDLVDRTSQISQSCSVGGSSAEKESRFTIAGRGGVQLSPTALLPAQASTSDWVGLDGPSSIASEPRFPDGSLLVLQPGQTYQVQVVCVNSWKEQQRSSL